MYYIFIYIIKCPEELQGPNEIGLQGNEFFDVVKTQLLNWSLYGLNSCETIEHFGLILFHIYVFQYHRFH